MASVNRVILIGNLGKDPEVQCTPSGVQIAKFSLATTESKKVGEEWENKTDWHNVVMFNKQAEYAGNKLRKGMSIYLEGKISYSSWDKEDGTKGYKVDIIGNVIKCLTKSEATTEQEDDLPY